MDQNQKQNQPGQKGQPEQFDRPNQNANKEPAEGSRDNVRGNQPPGQGQPGQQRPDQSGEGNRQGGGITNRPLEREQKEQDEIPPRGQTTSEDRDV